METMPLNAILLGLIPEALLLIYLGLILIGVRPDMKKLIFAAIVQGILVYYIRRHTMFGIHLLLQYVTLILLIWAVLKVHILGAVLSASIGGGINILIRGPMLLLIQSITGLSLGDILYRPWLRIFSFYPRFIILSIIIYLCVKYNCTLETEMNFLPKINGKIRS
ncbi:conserved hypothetical protein [Alkaliphilus metalliredigens QYMF]|uniref:Uncharacterized protein n=1 Tax=Alkaliphilus metalliredigens (strain QYMF) TaxID=293826 RepID=A6TLF8_ALKMQ|nr:hypothetical protein [Alkaliphilus metalliredigens]ABR47026.1 conserved hypothetical protein [Alkaliphilus metalliredigens QYMF]